MARRPDRTLDQVRDELLALQRHVGQLATDALHLRPSFRLALSRGQLKDLEAKLDAHSWTFLNLEADLAAHCDTPVDYNSAVRKAAHMQLHFGVRDSVRGALADTRDTIGSIRNALDYRLALAVSVAALIVALVSASADVLGMF